MVLDSGTKVLVVHNKPILYSQLKRLLLIFDEVHTMNPNEHEVFLREGSICYSYNISEEKILITANNGFEILKKFSYLERPSASENQILGAGIIHNGPNQKYIIPSDILHLYNGNINKLKLEELFKKFDYAINKGHLKILDLDEGDLNIKSSINLKISYDFDCKNPDLFNALRPTFEHRPNKMPEKMFLPSPPLITLNIPGVEIFPNSDYKKPYNYSLYDNYAFEHQYFSSVALILRALTAAGEYNLTPIFIDKNVFNFFKIKINSIRNSNNPELIELWKKFGSNYELSINQILIESSLSLLKDEVISNIPLPQIISYKEKRLDNLYSLRNEISNEIKTYQNLDLSSEKLKEIDKFLNEKLLVNIKIYNQKSFELFEKTIKPKSIKFITGMTSTSVGLLNGIDPFSAALLGGVSPFFVEAGLTLTSKILNQRQKKFFNTFSYFLDLNKK